MLHSLFLALAAIATQTGVFAYSPTVWLYQSESSPTIPGVLTGVLTLGPGCTDRSYSNPIRLVKNGCADTTYLGPQCLSSGHDPKDRQLSWAVDGCIWLYSQPGCPKDGWDKGLGPVSLDVPGESVRISESPQLK